MTSRSRRGRPGPRSRPPITRAPSQVSRPAPKQPSAPAKRDRSRQVSATPLHRIWRRTAALRPADWAVILLFLSPAVIIPEALDRFVFGKLVVAALGAGLAFLAPACGRMTTTVRILLGASAAVLALSSVLSVAPQSALLGRAPLSEGVLVLSAYLLAGLSGGRLLGPGREARTLDSALAAMACCAVLVGLLAIAESTGLRPLSSNLDRPGSLLGNASDEGALAVLYIGPLMASAIITRRTLSIVGACAAMLTIVLSASRGAILGLVVVLLVVAAISSRRPRLWAISAVAAAAGLAMAVPFTRDRIFGLTPLANQTVSGRTLLWQETLALIGRHPILGVGPSQLENAIVSEHTLRWQEEVGPANPPASPHNWILQAAVAGGPLLVALAFALVLMTCRAAWHQIRSGDEFYAVGTIAGLAGYAVALLFHFTAPSTTIPAAVLAGSLLAVNPPPVRAARDAWVRRGSVAAAVLLAACFFLASLAEIYLRFGDEDVARGRFADANRAYTAARLLRRWDVDLPAYVLHQFVARAASGSTGAVPYAASWARRVGPVEHDEQVAQNLAALAESKADYTDAAAILDRELHVDPNDPTLLLQRGVLYAQQGQNAQAESSLRRAAAIAPNDPEPWHDLGILYAAEGRSADAAAARATAQRLQAKTP